MIVWRSFLLGMDTFNKFQNKEATLFIVLDWKSTYAFYNIYLENWEKLIVFGVKNVLQSCHSISEGYFKFICFLLQNIGTR